MYFKFNLSLNLETVFVLCIFLTKQKPEFKLLSAALPYVILYMCKTLYPRMRSTIILYANIFRAAKIL